MDQVGSRRTAARTGRRGARVAVCMWGLGLLGLLGALAACGDDGGDSGAGEREDRPAADPEAEAEQTATSSTTASSTTTTTTPRVVYEIDGTGTVPVNYWIAGDRQQSAEATLPWSEEQAEEPSRLSMLVALVGSRGDVTCRIRRGTEVLAEATLSSDAGPLLACDYPPSGQPQVTFPPGM